MSPTDSAQLATDGAAASERLAADVAAARQHVARARDLLLLRAALAAPAATTPESLRARPDIAERDAKLNGAARILDQWHVALTGLRDTYRAFGAIAAGRDPRAFDALMDNASEDAKNLRTVIDRFSTSDTSVLDNIPSGDLVVGVARLTGAWFTRLRTASTLVRPNDALIDLLTELMEASGHEGTALMPVLETVATDRGEDVVERLRRSGIIRVQGTSGLERLADAYGWHVAAEADSRLRQPRSRSIRTGLDAIVARNTPPVPARLIDPDAGRRVLSALRDRHVALRDGNWSDPDALRDALRRLAA